MRKLRKRPFTITPPPCLYDLVMQGPTESMFLKPLRRSLVADLRGDVLEIGAGTGLSLSYFHPQARVVATELDPSSLGRLYWRAGEARASVAVVGADAMRLPFPDATFDALVCQLALCMISDTAGALSEARRVLKPGAPLRFLEHVRSTRRGWAWLQDRLAPVWFRFSGGCRLNQNTVSLIDHAGFRIERVEKHGGLLLPLRLIWARSP